jgi:hypothetical protein
MTSDRARLGTGLVALLTAITLLAPFLVAPAGAQAACAGVADVGDWTTITAPRFSTGGANMTGYAVAAYAPDTIYVTNGKVVMRTTDGGCGWKQVYVLPAVPDMGSTYTSDSASIVQVVTPETPGMASKVLLVIEESLLGAPRPHVVLSSDGGATWTSGDSGLPPQGHPDALVVAPVNPNIAYLGIDVGGGTVDTLLASGDGGATWSVRNDVSKGVFPQGIIDLAVDGIDPNSIWAWGTQGLYHSTDGGRSFTAMQEFAGASVASAAVSHASGSPARVIAYHSGRRSFLRSTDGGTNWGTIAGPLPTSIAHGADADNIMMTSAGDAFVFYTPTNSWINVQAPIPGATDALADRTSDHGYYVRTARTISVYKDAVAGKPGTKPIPRGLEGLGQLLDPGDFNQLPAKLTPNADEVRVRATKTKRVHYTLQMPPTPVPVDVYFLIDTGESMIKETNGLKRAVVNIQRGLVEAKMDAYFGLAQMRSYPDSFPPRSEEEERSFVIRQEVDVTNKMDLLQAAIEGLEALGGGQYDSQLGALWHTATGLGADLWPYNVPGGAGHDVPPGLNATWRDITGDDGVRVIIMATDEPFGGIGDNENRPSLGDGKIPEPPPIPSMDEVKAKLNAEEIKVVGLSSRDRSNTYVVTDHLQEISAGTGSIAKSEGVDCDGDGDADLSEGMALVCEVQESEIQDGSHLSAAVVNLVRGVATRSNVELEVKGADGIVRNVTPGSYSDVILQSSNKLGFDIDYHCPRSFKTTRRTVTITASSDDEVLDSTTARVICLGLEEDEPLGLFEAALVGIVPAIPPAPPVPVSSANATQSQTQAQSQAQAQGAAAKQEEEQPQVAFATAYDAWQEQLANEQLMVAYKKKPAWQTAPSFVLGASALALTFLYGCALAVRNSVAHAGPRRRR